MGWVRAQHLGFGTHLLIKSKKYITRTAKIYIYIVCLEVRWGAIKHYECVYKYIHYEHYKCNIKFIYIYMCIQLLEKSLPRSFTHSIACYLLCIVAFCSSCACRLHIYAHIHTCRHYVCVYFYICTSICAYIHISLDHVYRDGPITKTLLIKCIWYFHC